ncbi:VWA domain-containing protein [bacterium]|nr:MAG: VWA domain-containing protein [bacterium]
MTFQNPTALLWFLPLATILFVLYLLKMKRRELRVPATFLWPQKTEEIRANSLFQRLRFSWLLVLQLLAVALATVALARPQTSRLGLTGEVTVLVLDASASMSANDVSPSRFESAKKLAREAIQGSSGGDRIALIEAGPSPRVVFPLGRDSARQASALNDLKGTDAPSDMGEALRLAAALVEGIDGARIVLLSDGRFPVVDDFVRGKAAVVYRRVGELSDNVGITALGLGDGPQGRQLFAGVKNYGPAATGGTLSLYADGKAIDSVDFKVGPSKVYGHTIDAPAGAKVLEARIKVNGDKLKADDYSVALADPGAALKVLLVTKGDPFLERALALDPRVTLDRAAELPADADGKYDVVVFDGIAESPVQARGVMTLGAAGPGSPVTARGSSKPRFESQAKDRILDGVPFDGVFVDKAEEATLAAGAKALVEASTGPLLAVREQPGKRQVYLAFDPLQSDFPLQPAFPIFVANALTYLGGEAGTSTLSVATGSTFSVPTTKEATLKGPETEATLKPRNGTAVVREAVRSGAYTLNVDGKERAVFASLRDAGESNIAPVDDLQLGGGAVKAQAAPRRFADFWRPLVALALLVLVGEWWLFVKRS